MIVANSVLHVDQWYPIGGGILGLLVAGWLLYLVYRPRTVVSLDAVLHALDTGGKMSFTLKDKDPDSDEDVPMRMINNLMQIEYYNYKLSSMEVLEIKLAGCSALFHLDYENRRLRRTVSSINQTVLAEEEWPKAEEILQKVREQIEEVVKFA